MLMKLEDKLRIIHLSNGFPSKEPPPQPSLSLTSGTGAGETSEQDGEKKEEQDSEEYPDEKVDAAEFEEVLDLLERCNIQLEMLLSSRQVIVPLAVLTSMRELKKEIDDYITAYLCTIPQNDNDIVVEGDWD
jgi:hypothetical protein